MSRKKEIRKIVKQEIQDQQTYIIIKIAGIFYLLTILFSIGYISEHFDPAINSSNIYENIAQVCFDITSFIGISFSIFSVSYIMFWDRWGKRL